MNVTIIKDGKVSEVTNALSIFTSPKAGFAMISVADPKDENKRVWEDQPWDVIKITK